MNVYGNYYAKSGTYWEYICSKCGWFPSLPCNDDNTDKVKNSLEVLITEHNKKHNLTTPVYTDEVVLNRTKEVEDE